MKKKTKVIISASAAVAVVLAIVIIVLACIVTRPFENLADYKYAVIYNGSADTSEEYILSDTQDPDKKNSHSELKSLLEENKYSVLKSVLSGRTATENKPCTDSEGESITLSETDLKSPTSIGLYGANVESLDVTVPKIKLVYGEVKTVVIGKEEYTFDTVEFLVPNTQNEIRDILVVVYSQADFEMNNSDDGDDTDLPKTYGVFTVMANTTALNSFVKNI